MGFTFTSLAECETCGAPLSSSGDECDECAESEIVTLVFRKLNTNETKELSISMAASRDFMWEELAKSCDGTDPRVWFVLGIDETIENHLDSVMFDEIKELPTNGIASDYRGSEDLCELANYETT